MKIPLLTAGKFLLIFFVLSIYSTIYPQNSKTDEQIIDEDIVLEIPPVKITRYEYEKNKNEFITKYKRENKKLPSDSALAAWNNEFIDNTYLLADLYTKGYDKRDYVIKSVNGVERVILIQKNGPIYNEFVTSKINIPEEAVKAAYDRSDKHIKVQYLKFPSLLSAKMAISATKNGKLETKEDFENLVTISKENPQISSDTTELIWPYFGMGTVAERIYNLKKDDVIIPIEIKSGIFAFYVKEVYNTEKMTFEEAKSKIMKILEANEKTMLEDKLSDKINRMVSSQINELVCAKFMEKYNIEFFKDLYDSTKKEKLYEHFKKILKDTILTYSIRNEKSFLSIEGFLNYYSYLPMMTVFRNTDGLSKVLPSYAQEEYQLQLADSLGITRSTKHKLDKTNFLNKTIVDFYEKTNLLPKIKLTSEEIEKYYEENKNKFIESAEAKILVYTFDTQQHANQAMRQLLKNSNNTSKLEGFMQLDSNITVKRINNIFTKDVTRTVFNLKNNQLSKPLKHLNDYIIIKKINEIGSILKPISDVKEEIARVLKESEYNVKIREGILLVKQRFRIQTNNISSVN